MIDRAHQLHLAASLLEICLIDTEGINPQSRRLTLVPPVSEEVPQIVTDNAGPAIEDDLVLWCLGSPYIRERFVRNVTQRRSGRGDLRYEELADNWISRLSRLKFKYSEVVAVGQRLIPSYHL